MTKYIFIIIVLGLIVSFFVRNHTNREAAKVNTLQAEQFLQNNNCFIVQGYYFSKPIAEHELPNLYERLNELANSEVTS